MKCIVPCAGFGTRMSMAKDCSKEMLPDPGYKHQPIIQYVLDLCEAFKLEPLVITRKEKQDLRQYLFDKQVDFIDIDVKGEWNESVLASKELWAENNLLILPDTRFYSYKCIEDIQRGLELGNNAVMALHEVTDPSKWSTWGMIFNNHIYEKPNLTDYYWYENYTKEPEMKWAWGLIGFKDTYGQELFSNIQCLELKNVGFTYLTKFEDITRGTK